MVLFYNFSLEHVRNLQFKLKMRLSNRTDLNQGSTDQNLLRLMKTCLYRIKNKWKLMTFHWFQMRIFKELMYIICIRIKRNLWKMKTNWSNKGFNNCMRKKRKYKEKKRKWISFKKILSDRDLKLIRFKLKEQYLLELMKF